MESFEGDEHALIDTYEAAALASGVLIDIETKHVFTPGLVSRTVFMPKGSIVTSFIHAHKHQYVVSMGACDVFIPGKGVERIVAPFCGVTEAGTRRVLKMHEDTIWTTFHPSDATTVDEFEAEEFIPHDFFGSGESARDWQRAIMKELRKAAEKEFGE